MEPEDVLNEIEQVHGIQSFALEIVVFYGALQNGGLPDFEALELAREYLAQRMSVITPESDEDG